MEDILDSERQYDPNDGPTLEQLRAEGYKFDFGRYFATGWRAMKNDIGLYVLFAFVGGLLSILSVFTFIGIFIVILPLMAGFTVFAKKALLDEPREFKDFFGGFKYIGPLLVYILIMMGVGLLLAVPFFLVAGVGAISFNELFDNPDLVGPALAASLGPMQFGINLISIAIQALLIFVIPLIVIGQLGAGSAIKWSIRLATKNFWWLVLYAFVVGIIQQFGLLFCLIGVFFTLPLAQCLMVGAYAEIVGLGDKRTTDIN